MQVLQALRWLTSGATFAIFCLLGFANRAGVSRAAEPAPVAAEVVEVRKIWDRAAHNAFTDLVRHDDAWYCAFREGKAHVSNDGKIRVIRSEDGEKWESAGLLESTDYDLRDAGISTMPDGRLMLLGGATVIGPPRGGTGTFVSFSDDGKEWTTPRIVLEPGRWLWKTTWHDGKAYGVAYATGGAGPCSLMVSEDGVDFREHVGKLVGDGWPTEARVRFDESGEAYCLQRRDKSPNSALLGRAAPPYDKWKWSDLGAYFGGPNFIRTPHGEWIGVGRLLDGGARTSVVWLDPDHGAMTELARLPSGGDTSYPGLVWHDDMLWVSYYSSHEARTSIYLAKVKVVPQGSAPVAEQGAATSGGE